MVPASLPALDAPRRAYPGRYCPHDGLALYTEDGGASLCCPDCGPIPEAETLQSEAQYERTLLAVRYAREIDGRYVDSGIRIYLPDRRWFELPTQEALEWAMTRIRGAQFAAWVSIQERSGKKHDLRGEYAFLLAGHILAAGEGDYGEHPEPWFAEMTGRDRHDPPYPWADLLEAHQRHRAALYPPQEEEE